MEARFKGDLRSVSWVSRPRSVRVVFWCYKMQLEGRSVLAMDARVGLASLMAWCYSELFAHARNGVVEL